MNINIDNIIAIRKGKKPQSLSPNKSKGFIEKTVDEALQQAEALRQSILKKAFEGALV